MPPTIRAHLIISGRVQGVCYRAATQQEALRIGVSGWVRNKPDGSVEAEIEGSEPDVKNLIAWCQKGPRLSQVAAVTVTWKSARGGTDGFHVRY